MPPALQFSPVDNTIAYQQALNSLNQAIAEKTNSEQLVAEMMRLCGSTLNAAGGAVWVTEAADQPQMILENNMANLGLVQDKVPLPGLLVAVRRTAREGRPLIVPPFVVDQDADGMPLNPSSSELLYLPMKLGGRVAMVLCMAVGATADTGLHRAQIGFLQRMVASVETAFTERHINMIEQDRGLNTRIVQFAEQVHRNLFLSQVAVDIANLVRDMVSAERVTVELYPHMRRKIAAVSNVDEVNRRAALFQAQRLVLDYVRDRAVAVVLDRAAAEQLVSDPQMQDAAVAYFAASDFNAFVAAPIKNDDEVLGVVLAEYHDVQAAQDNTRLLGDLARMCTSSVNNAVEYEAIPLRRVLFGVSQLWRKPSAKKNTIIGTVAGTLAILFVVTCLIPFQFAVKADCRLEPAAQFDIASPMRGRIIKVPVQAGEHVHPGQPLVQFDTTRLRVELAEQQRKYQELRVKLKAMQQSGHMSKIAEAQAQTREVQKQVGLLQHELRQATVRSPIEGTVLTEHVQQLRWASKKPGAPLLNVASFNDWLLEVDVPESDVALVHDALAKAANTAKAHHLPDLGVKVQYILYPWPGRIFTTHAAGTSLILPASAEAHHANVFRLRIPVKRSELPPGISLDRVTGRVKIDVGHATLMHQWTRGLVRLLRMTLFF